MTPHPEDRTQDALLSLYNLAYYMQHHRGHRAHVDAALNAIVNNGSRSVEPVEPLQID